MKRPLILIAMPLFLISCASGSAQNVQAPDIASYKAVEVTSKSNSDRILKLETELDSAKDKIESLRIQNRQLADSYDGLVELFKEHRQLTMTILARMNAIFGAVEDDKGESTEPK
ncbi:hypothetical protein Dacet_1684 [Denitrovibrio acetiphilus DSM 12809]|uniref:Uncharacterized protein n=1 Tax=Denitrovibrio acetiphilus (strain DSM 12809 / NBRC 114555 / N2460) TaxID=522772 RepID=D4H8U9_DENA2|nr:hypothetical protein [Denitrovibrio acetiphilus]ADD68448.1 hypothetical protein Dacet_1684 [Denitrovibrio acetiphilus DSM 12809]